MPHAIDRSSLIATFSVLAFAGACLADVRDARADEPAGLGGPGESCKARSDCSSGLKCVANVCRDEMEGASCTSRADCGGKLACVAEKCVVPGSAGPSASDSGAGNGAAGNGAAGNGAAGNGAGGGDSGGKKWKGFEGLRGFGGITLGGGPTVASGLGLGTTTQGGFLFGLKGGILYDRVEVGAEISPVTFLPLASVSGSKPVLQVNVYAGYHIKLAGPVSWPLRGGIGLEGVNTNDQVFFQGRADLVGISALLGPVLLDLHAPSFRLFVNDSGAVLHFMFGIGGAILPDAFF
jgi:hypothetical protein